MPTKVVVISRGRPLPKAKRGVEYVYQDMPKVKHEQGLRQTYGDLLPTSFISGATMSKAAPRSLGLRMVNLASIGQEMPSNRTKVREVKRAGVMHWTRKGTPKRTLASALVPRTGTKNAKYDKRTGKWMPKRAAPYSASSVGVDKDRYAALYEPQPSDRIGSNHAVHRVQRELELAKAKRKYDADPGHC